MEVVKTGHLECFGLLQDLPSWFLHHLFEHIGMWGSCGDKTWMLHWMIKEGKNSFGGEARTQWQNPGWRNENCFCWVSLAGSLQDTGTLGPGSFACSAGESHGPRTLQEIKSNPGVKVSKGAGRRHTRIIYQPEQPKLCLLTLRSPCIISLLGRTEIMHTFMDSVPLKVSSKRMNNTRSIFYKYKWWDNVELMKSQSAISLKTCCKHLNFFFSQPCILWRIL